MPLNWKLTITIMDDKRQKSMHSVYMLHRTEATATEWAGRYIKALNDIITGQIVGANISIPVELPANLRVAPDPVADVEEGITVFYLMDAPKAKVSSRIPTINEAHLSGETLFIDGDVLTWLTIVQEAGTDVINNPILGVKHTKPAFKRRRWRK
jgi:hypothetical protein